MAKAIKFWLSISTILVAMLLVGCSDEPTPSPVPDPTASQAPAPIASAIDTPTPSPVPTATPTQIATPIPTVTFTPEPTATPTQTATLTPTAAPTQVATPTPTVTLTPEPTAMPAQTAAPTPTATLTPEPTATPTPVPTPTAVPTPTHTPEPEDVGTPEMDRAALEELYNATDGANWSDNQNWLSDAPVREWYGVDTGSDGRVTELRLFRNNLRGEIPFEIGNLTRLRSLNLGGNELSGEIPSELGNLTRLSFLALDYNQLTGNVPPELGNLRNLGILGLHINELSGELPSELGQLVNLTWLNFSNNQLSGTLPQEMSRIRNLGEFFFDNNLSLCAPHDAEFQIWLERIDKWDGDICVPLALPEDIVADRAALVALYHSTEGGERWFNDENWLSDEPLHTWYGVRTAGGRVTEVRLRRNGLWGEIPDELRMLTRLEVLDLGDNEIVGPLPGWVGELSHLRRLLLDRNVFTGELPPELGSLSRLEEFTLDDSAGFYGKLPETLTRLDKLRRLIFHRTALCVPLDEGFQRWLDGISDWRGWDCPPGAKDLPIPTEVSYPIVTREQGYGYTIDIPDDWEDRGDYIESVPEGELTIRAYDLLAETTLTQFAESLKDNLEQELSASAYVFEITSFEKRQWAGQDSYIIEYLQGNSPDYCVKDVVERIVLRSSLPGPPRGYRLRHGVCDWELTRQLDRVRRETLDSFRIVTNDDAYYSQFISRPGVLIKAPGKVDPEALKKAAEILDVMLDGRPDIPDCLGRIGSGLAIVADGDPLTALPEHAHRRGGDPYANSRHVPGAGGGSRRTPVSATPEQMLRGFDGYPPFRDVHEPGHHVQICFTESDILKWVDLYQDAVERVGTIDDPIDRLATINYEEFWAGFTSFYFHRHYAPRRYAEQLYPEAFALMESIYGKLTPTESDHPGYAQYVTASGHKLPWLVPGGLTYENDTFGYRIDLLPGWVVKEESTHELLLVSRNWPWPEIRIEYTRLPGRVDPDEALVDFAESRRLDWEKKTGRWYRSEVKSFERESLDGGDTYWAHFYGLEWPESCEVDIVERVLLATHSGDTYGVALQGRACGEGNQYALQDFETMLGSFILPGSKRTPALESTHSPTLETDSSEIAGLERDALVALYNSTGGERWHNNENWLSDRPLDEWYGVRMVGGRVTKLFLNSNRLRGRIPAELENLTNLRELWFGDNNGLTGEVPSELSSLTRLEVIDVSRAGLSGSIPAWLGELRGLRKLYLSGNRFEGEVPAELGSLTNLGALILRENRGLRGPLPEAFTGLRELYWIELGIISNPTQCQFLCA